jgi:transcriptional regulator with XRE-family HTH domain
VRLHSNPKCNILINMSAKLLIDWLLERGLTQTEIERRSGVSQSMVSCIYTGKRGKRTSYDVVMKLQTLRDQVMREDV